MSFTQENQKATKKITRSRQWRPNVKGIFIPETNVKILFIWAEFEQSRLQLAQEILTKLNSEVVTCSQVLTAVVGLFWFFFGRLPCMNDLRLSAVRLSSVGSGTKTWLLIRLCWLRTRPRWPSQTCDSLSVLTVITPFICGDSGWQEMAAVQNKSNPRKPDEGKRAEAGQVEVAKFRGKRERKSWFCVLCAKGPCGSVWWHSTSLTRQRLGAAALGSSGDLLALIHPEPFPHSRNATLPLLLRKQLRQSVIQAWFRHIFKTRYRVSSVTFIKWWWGQPDTGFETTFL